MAPRPRPSAKPEVWATGLAGLLSMEETCLWKVNHKARFFYSKMKDKSFDSASWKAEHNAQLMARVKELREDGWSVTIENDNRFVLIGNLATLTGKPDIVATRGMEVRIEDIKTGAKLDKHWWQVLIYVLAWRHVGQVPPLATITGAVIYGDAQIRIDSEELTKSRASDVWAKLREIGTVDPTLVPTPAPHECVFCDIADCEYRETVTDPITSFSSDF